MSQKRVAVVTGANKGIGFGVVKKLCANFNGIVYLTARDVGRGTKAQQDLAKFGLTAQFHQLDLDDMNSIDTFADYIRTTHGGLDVLVNNAAVTYKEFAEQAEPTLRVNYFGMKYLCHKLFPILRANARVVNLSSDDGHLTRVNGDEPFASKLREKLASTDLTEDELTQMVVTFIKCAKDGSYKTKGWPCSSYRMSKVAACALTRIQQRRCDQEPRLNILVNAVHPGYVATDATSHLGHMTIEEGAMAASYLALLPAGVCEPRGALVWHDKQVVDWINGPLPGDGY
ncbi:unnamed protein product [Meganyctiphanes norvegica]|uniref:Carbonyl reductase n=1 Tax=Meganyctiphanes norvegica TaxID=48144 RepID=A0AAV2RYI8_MEGNR